MIFINPAHWPKQASAIETWQASEETLGNNKSLSQNIWGENLLGEILQADSYASKEIAAA